MTTIHKIVSSYRRVKNHDEEHHLSNAHPSIGLERLQGARSDLVETFRHLIRSEIAKTRNTRNSILDAGYKRSS